MLADGHRRGRGEVGTTGEPITSGSAQGLQMRARRRAAISLFNIFRSVNMTCGWARQCCHHSRRHRLTLSRWVSTYLCSDTCAAFLSPPNDCDLPSTCKVWRHEAIPEERRQRVFLRAQFHLPPFTALLFLHSIRRSPASSSPTPSPPRRPDFPLLAPLFLGGQKAPRQRRPRRR
jgi:hypothetical protein